MVHAKAKHYLVGYFFVLCTSTMIKATEHETLCFLSYLDAGELILQHSCTLAESDTDDDQWSLLHDALLGKLTRLEHELKQLTEQKDAPVGQGESPVVVVSDFDFLVMFMRKAEDILKLNSAISPLILHTITKIKHHLCALLYTTC